MSREEIFSEPFNKKTLRIIEPQGNPDVIICDGMEYKPEQTCEEVLVDKFFRGCSNCGYMWEYMYGIGQRTRPNFCPKCGYRVKGKPDAN